MDYVRAILHPLSKYAESKLLVVISILIVLHCVCVCVFGVFLNIR